MYSSSSGSSTSSDPSDELSKKIQIDFIESAPQSPELSRQICFDGVKSLQAFLKLSRFAVDDNLKTNLNSILNHNETNGNSIFKFVKPDNSKESLCLPLLKQFIFPEWNKRLEVIKYCQNELNDHNPSEKMNDDGFSKLSEEERNEMLRIDPYTYKNLEQKYLQRNAKIIELKNLYDNEEKIENIIMNRSIELMNDLCQLDSFNINSQFLDYSSKILKK